MASVTHSTPADGTFSPSGASAPAPAAATKLALPPRIAFADFVPIEVMTQTQIDAEIKELMRLKMMRDDEDAMLLLAITAIL